MCGIVQKDRLTFIGVGVGGGGGGGRGGGGGGGYPCDLFARQASEEVSEKVS